MTVSIANTATKSARAKLLKANKKASILALESKGFEFLAIEGKGTKAESVYTHADGTTARFGSATDNVVAYIKPEGAAKERKARTTYTFDQPVYLASRMKRLLGEVGATAKFDRPNQSWSVLVGKKEVGTLTPAELEAISGNSLMGMVAAAA